MTNKVTIDLSSPEIREALADCDPGETHSLTMEIMVEEKGDSLVGVVDPSSIEKYEEEYEDAEDTGETPKAVTILLKQGEA